MATDYTLVLQTDKTPPEVFDLMYIRKDFPDEKEICIDERGGVVRHPTGVLVRIEPAPPSMQEYYLREFDILINIFILFYGFTGDNFGEQTKIVYLETDHWLKTTSVDMIMGYSDYENVIRKNGIIIEGLDLVSNILAAMEEEKRVIRLSTNEALWKSDINVSALPVSETFWKPEVNLSVLSRNETLWKPDIKEGISLYRFRKNNYTPSSNSLHRTPRGASQTTARFARREPALLPPLTKGRPELTSSSP